jgi:allantoinase
MSLPPEYLRYARRRKGSEHDRYTWAESSARAPGAWPNGTNIALWVMPVLEWFPLNMQGKPFLPHGGLDGSYPDTWGYTHRDYGNRVGIYRIMRVLDRLGIRATAAVNSSVALRYPALIRSIVDRGWEVLAHGRDMAALHHSGLGREEERQLIRASLKDLRDASGQDVRGWLSPANSESWQTPELLVEEGVKYICDWVNDDLPFRFSTAGGSLLALPPSHELTDAYAILENGNSTQEYAEQIVESFRVLYAEAQQGSARILSIVLHPWISGQPHRISAIEKALSTIMNFPGIWSATAGEIVAACDQLWPTDSGH